MLSPPPPPPDPPGSPVVHPGLPGSNSPPKPPPADVIVEKTEGLPLAPLQAKFGPPPAPPPPT